MTEQPPPSAEALPDKEQTHQRFWQAFRDWFMANAGTWPDEWDVWGEHGAPDDLASIAVELADALCDQRVSAETDRCFEIAVTEAQTAEDGEWYIARNIADAIRAPAERPAPESAYEICARWHDQQYHELRDNPTGPEGLVTGIAGAHMAAHRESAEHHRAAERPAPEGPQQTDEIKYRCVKAPYPCVFRPGPECPFCEQNSLRGIGVEQPSQQTDRLSCGTGARPSPEAIFHWFDAWL